MTDNPMVYGAWACEGDKMYLICTRHTLDAIFQYLYAMRGEAKEKGFESIYIGPIEGWETESRDWIERANAQERKHGSIRWRMKE